MEERFQKQVERIKNIAKIQEEYQKGEKAEKEAIKKRQEKEVKRF